jgi:pyruvate dehydrogenase E2 component (dihydrolipoamide acetyltransferase)
MPALGMAQETGKLVRWLKRDGEPVVKGEPLMEVETDKATVVVEAVASGVLAGITAAEGDEIAVGRPIAMILDPGEPDTKAAVISPSRSVASPKARRLAAERGVDLSGIRGSGPDGAVVESDVLQAGGSVPQTEPALWRAMADNVSRSWREAPHFFVIREVDASAVVAARKGLGPDVTYTDLLIDAVARALRSHQAMNGGSAEVNIGLAVAAPDGLIVPVLHNADQLGVAGIAARRAELVEGVQAGRLRARDMSGATFTLSNLGMYGVDLFTAILTEGQAGILAVGRITDRVVAQEGVPQVRPTMFISLSCDHRRVDGARAAQFMQTLVAILEE